MEEGQGAMAVRHAMALQNGSASHAIPDQFIKPDNTICCTTGANRGSACCKPVLCAAC